MAYNELIDKVQSYLSHLKEEGETHVPITKRRSRFETISPPPPASPAAAKQPTPTVTRPTSPAATPAQDLPPLTLCLAQRVPECGGPDANTQLAFIGEAEEFNGPAGGLLAKMLYAMGYQLEAERKTWANETDSPHTLATLALGQQALDRTAGKRSSLTMMRGRPFTSPAGNKVIPTFTPSYLNQNPAAKKAMWKDMLAMLEQLQLDLPPWSQKFKK